MPTRNPGHVEGGRKDDEDDEDVDDEGKDDDNDPNLGPSSRQQGTASLVLSGIPCRLPILVMMGGIDKEHKSILLILTKLHRHMMIPMIVVQPCR